jgi:hypothetical protein
MSRLIFEYNMVNIRKLYNQYTINIWSIYNEYPNIIWLIYDEYMITMTNIRWIYDYLCLIYD